MPSLPIVSASVSEIKAIAETSFEGFISYLMNILMDDIKTIMKGVDNFPGLDEDMFKILTLVNAVEHVQDHLEFVLAVLKSSSDDEVEAIKENFKVIENYKDIKSKADINVVVLKAGLIVLYEPMFAELNQLVSKLFKINEKAESEIVRSEDNRANLNILIGRFDLCKTNIPILVNYNKECILSLEHNHPTWQNLHKSAIYKEPLTKQEVDDSFSLLHHMVHTLHATVQRSVAVRDQIAPFSVRGLLKIVGDLAYYGTQQSKAKAEAFSRLVKPDPHDSFHVWNLTNNPVVATFFSLKFPMIGQDDLLHVPRLFPAITTETILKEYEDNTFNKINPMDSALFAAPALTESRSEIVRSLLTADKAKIPVRMIADDKIDYKEEGTSMVKGMIMRTIRGIRNLELAKPENNDTAIVIHIHGGGFVSMSSLAHRMYLYRMAKHLKLVHFSIDYRLSPEAQYPGPLDDVWQAYMWITNYAKNVLGINYKKVILMGDSAGGNLCMALMMKLIKVGLPVPDGCLLIYPCLVVDSETISPSYLTSITNSLLPVSILSLIVKAYVPQGIKTREDPLLSPIFASDELLAKLPPITMITAEDDPIQDDNWKFLHRMQKLDKEVKFVLYRHLPHGFLCHQDLKNYNEIIEDISEHMRELINSETPTAK